MSESEYRVSNAGGRVKSAGLPFDFLTNLGDEFSREPSLAGAAEMATTFRSLRKNPPGPLRDRFFPLSRAEVKSMTQSTPALLRPVLKTDQGPGMFLPFEISQDGSSIPYIVAREEGYIIPEVYFERQLNEAPNKVALGRMLGDLMDKFDSGDLGEAQLAFQRFQDASEQAGLTFRRNANVGRYALFFIHPGVPEERIEISVDVAEGVRASAYDTFNRLIDKSDAAKRQFAEEQGLPYRRLDSFGTPHYFQVDAQILPNGEVVTAEIQVPDVGMFLNGLEYDYSVSVSEIQRMMIFMRGDILGSFDRVIREAKSSRGNIPIYLVTRSDVVDKEEDTLEILELEEVKKGLAQCGHLSEVVSALQASEMDDDCLMFLFNIDPNSSEFAKLARAYLGDQKRKLLMCPDPFFRAAEQEATQYHEVVVAGEQLSNFMTLAEPTETDPKKIFTQLMALDGYLRGKGVDEDVIHICHPQLSTPIPIYRYDQRSIQIAANVIKAKGIDYVRLRSIPISVDRSVLRNRKGNPYYATFRFMLYRI